MSVDETAANGAQIIVTGSEGFVGRHVRAAVARRGGKTIGVDRPGTRAEIPIDLAAPDFHPSFLWDRVSGNAVSVVHMAANITRTSSVDSAARSNLRVIAEAPVRIIEEGVRRGVCSHIVDCSTFKVFGPASQILIHAATHPRRPDPFSYGSAKALAERLLTIAAQRDGFAFSTVHPTCIYGPGQHLQNAIPTFLSAILRGEPPTVYGDGKSIRDDVYVADLADLLVEAALRRATGSFQAAGERARTILEVAEACCAAVAAIGGPSGIAPRRVCDRPPKWWLDQCFDLAPTVAAFGYTPTPLAAGLAAESEWLRAGAPDESVRFAKGSS
jgi:UDP-glucose 4-epimerase